MSGTSNLILRRSKVALLGILLFTISCTRCSGTSVTCGSTEPALVDYVPVTCTFENFDSGDLLEMTIFTNRTSCHILNGDTCRGQFLNDGILMITPTYICQRATTHNSVTCLVDTRRVIQICGYISDSQHCYPLHSSTSSPTLATSTTQADNREHIITPNFAMATSHFLTQSSPSPPSTNIGLIVGMVLALAIIIVVILLLLGIWKKCRTKNTLERYRNVEEVEFYNQIPHQCGTGSSECSVMGLPQDTGGGQKTTVTTDTKASLTVAQESSPHHHGINGTPMSNCSRGGDEQEVKDEDSKNVRTDCSVFVNNHDTQKDVSRMEGVTSNDTPASNLRESEKVSKITTTAASTESTDQTDGTALPVHTTPDSQLSSAVALDNGVFANIGRPIDSKQFIQEDDVVYSHKDIN